MKNKKILGFMSACLAFTMILSGCEKIVLVEGKPGNSSGTENTSSSSEETIKAYPITLNGTEITKSPERVISLTPAYTEILCEMGYKSKLVGICDYCDYPEDISSLPTAGSSTSPDIEKIMSINPDLVITATHIVTKDRIALEARGIKILTVSSPSTIEEFLNIYKFFGLCFEGIFTGEDKGKNTFSSIQRLITSAGNTKKRSFVYISPTLSPAGGNTFESAVLSLYGENCAKSGDGYTYPAESLLTNQPDVIFISDSTQKDFLLGDETYSQLNAVINDNIILVESKYFERPSGRIKALLSMLNEEFANPPAQTTTAVSSAESVPEETEINEE